MKNKAQVKFLSIICISMFLIGFLLTSSYAAMIPTMETRIDPPPQKVVFVGVNELNPSYKVDDLKNSFRHFRLTWGTSINVEKINIGGYETIRSITSSGASDDWYADFKMGTGYLADIVKTGDLEMMVVFDAQNKKRSVWYEDDLVNFLLVQETFDSKLITNRAMYGYEAPLGYYGSNTINTGWVSVEKNASVIWLRFYSTKGEKKDNAAAITNVRVYFRDKNGPTVKSTLAVSNKTKTYKQGEEIKFRVLFSEYVKHNGDITMDKKVAMALNITDGSGNYIGKADFQDISVSGNTSVLNYSFVVPKGFDVKGLSARIPSGVTPFANIMDASGNTFMGGDIPINAISNGLYNMNIDSVGPNIKDKGYESDIEIIAQKNSNYLRAGEEVRVKVRFSEPVLYNTDTRIEMNNGGFANAVGYSNGNRDIIEFKYIVGAGLTAEVNKLDVKATNSNGKWTVNLTGNITDNLGNPLTSKNVRILDAGNSKVTTCQASIDNTTPLVEIVTDGTNWSNTHVVTFSVTDNKAIDSFKFKIVGCNYNVIKINNSLQNTSFISGLTEIPATQDIQVELETAQGGEFKIEVIAVDKSGNSATKYSESMKFDKIAPNVRFTYDNSQTGSVNVHIIDNETGFESDGVKMQWVDKGADPSVDGWDNIETDNLFLSKGIEYTSRTLRIENPTAGVITQKKLYIKAKDLYNNEVVTASQLLYEDLSNPEYTVHNFAPRHAGELFQPVFDCYVEAKPGTEVRFKWVKPNGDINNTQWVSLSDINIIPVEQLSNYPFYTRNFEETRNFGRISVQKYFNNGIFFNGQWNLYLEVTYTDPLVSGYTSQAIAGPFDFYFDNISPEIVIGEQTNKVSKELDIKIKIIEKVNGEDLPFVASDKNYYVWKDSNNNEIGRGQITEKEFSLNNVHFETGSYELEVYFRNNHEEVLSNKKTFYFDQISPRGEFAFVDYSTNKIKDISIFLNAMDLTSNNSNNSLQYSISIDEEKWSDWGEIIVSGYEGSSQIAPTEEEKGMAIDHGGRIVISNFVEMKFDLPNNIIGRHSIRVKLRDNGGNESDILSSSIFYDTAPPKAIIGYSTTEKTNQPVTITIDRVSDDYSMDDHIYVYNRIEGGPVEQWNTWSIEVTENTDMILELVDYARNIVAVPIKIDWIDNKSPELLYLQQSDLNNGAISNSGKRILVDVIAFDIAKLYYCLSPYRLNPDEYIDSDAEQYSSFRWNEAVDKNTLTEQVSTTIGEDGKVHYLLKLYNNNQGLTDNDANYHTLYLKAVDEVGNNSYKELDFFFNGNNPQVLNKKYSPEGVEDDTNPTKTGGPVKVELEYDEPVVMVPLYGVYAIPTDFNSYNRNQVVYIAENGLRDVKVINRFGTESIVSIYVGGIDKKLQPKTTFSPDSWTKDTVTVTIVAGENQLIYNFSVPTTIAQLVNQEGSTVFKLNGVDIVGYKKISYKFVENGELEYSIYNYVEGTFGKSSASVDKIDRTAPTALIGYDSSSLYGVNGEILNTGYIKAFLYNLSDKTNLLNGATHIFTENGRYDFVIEDLAGNRTTIAAIVDSINKISPTVDTTPPTADISLWIESVGGPEIYDPTSEWSNSNVHVVIAPIDENKVTITNNGGENKYTFTENGTFTFNLEDSVGNKADIVVSVDKIDKKAPVGELFYKQEDASQITTATLTVTDENGVVNIMNIGGAYQKDGSGNPYYVFNSNGSFVFYVQDIARNIASFKATVDNIDLMGPEYNISGVPTAPTNKDVRIVIDSNEALSKAYIVGGETAIASLSISKANKQVNVLMTDNGKIDIRIVDLKGNYKDLTIDLINIIDKIAPTADVTIDDSLKLGQGIVTATLNNISDNISSSDKIKVVNNKGSITKIFSNNEAFEFIIIDEAGNETYIPVNIIGIDKTKPVLTLDYSTNVRTKDSVIVTLKIVDDSATTILSNNGSPTIVFTNNGSYTFLVEDEAGNQSSIRAKVENIDIQAPTITFANSDNIIILEGESYNLKDYYAIDNVDGDVTSNIKMVMNGFDSNKPGNYTILYTVSDLIGNTTTVSRNVEVVSKNLFRTFINGVDALNGVVITNGPNINLRIMNQRGYALSYWKPGRVAKGLMKTGASSITANNFKVNEIGWYTVLIQGQEKESYLIYIYVTNIQ